METILILALIYYIYTKIKNTNSSGKKGNKSNSETMYTKQNFEKISKNNSKSNSKVSSKYKSRSKNKTKSRNNKIDKSTTSYKSNAKNKFYTKVVGVTFNNRQKIIQNLSKGQELILERKPENPHDKNAVAVFAMNDGIKAQIGYLKKELAKKISPQIKSGKSFNCYIKKITGGYNGKYYGVNIVIKSVNYSGKNKTEREVYPSDMKIPPEKHPDACCGYQH